MRVEGESTSGEARVEGESTSGDARVEGESTSGEARVEGESTSGEVRVMGEQSTSNDGEEQDSTVKRPRLEDIGTLAAEPLQEWLENLHRDDLRHFALLLYTTLPSKFGLLKTDTATAVADILQKSERTVRRWIYEFVQNDGEFSDVRIYYHHGATFTKLIILYVYVCISYYNYKKISGNLPCMDVCISYYKMICPHCPLK